MFSNYLDYVQFATGLIKIDEENNLYFTHKSIQDFLCSNFLVESVSSLNKNIFHDKDWDKILQMISGLSSDPNYIISNILSDKKRDHTDKINNCMSVCNQSVLLSKNDIKKSFLLLEEFLVEFEKCNNLKKNNIVVENNHILINLIKDTKGFKEVLVLLNEIYKIRFTKYEYDFYGYLKKSKSKLLKSISNFNEKKTNISFSVDQDQTRITYIEESPNITD